VLRWGAGNIFEDKLRARAGPNVPRAGQGKILKFRPVQNSNWCCDTTYLKTAHNRLLILPHSSFASYTTCAVELQTLSPSLQKPTIASYPVYFPHSQPVRASLPIYIQVFQTVPSFEVSNQNVMFALAATCFSSPHIPNRRSTASLVVLGAEVSRKMLIAGSLSVINIVQNSPLLKRDHVFYLICTRCIKWTHHCLLSGFRRSLVQRGLH
jgi:hypothetical protein